MCIMSVREGQHHSTVAQSCLHNLNTVISDLEMFSKMLESEGNVLRAAQVEECKMELDQVQYHMRQLYGKFVADRIHAEQGENLASGELSDAVAAIVLLDVEAAKHYQTRSKLVEGDVDADVLIPHTPPFDYDTTSPTSPRHPEHV